MAQHTDEHTIHVSPEAYEWLAVALTPAVLFGPLTYAVYYGGLVTSEPVSLPDLVGVMWATVAGVGLIVGLVCGGCRRLLRLAAFATAGLVGGHLVWAAMSRDVGASFALSNGCELIASLILAFAARKATDPEP